MARDEQREDAKGGYRVEWLRAHYDPGEKTLDLSEAPGEVTDEDLPLIAGLGHQLKVLILSGAAISDRALETVLAIEGLEELDVSMTNVGDRGMAVLGRCRNLLTLNVRRAGVTDEGIKHLVGHPHLRDLLLDHNPITDAVFDVVGTMPDLTDLALVGTRVSDVGLNRIVEEVPQLRHLHLGGPAISLAMLNLLALGLDDVGWHGHDRYEWDARVREFRMR